LSAICIITFPLLSAFISALSVIIYANFRFYLINTDLFEWAKNARVASHRHKSFVKLGNLSGGKDCQILLTIRINQIAHNRNISSLNPVNVLYTLRRNINCQKLKINVSYVSKSRVDTQIVRTICLNLQEAHIAPHDNVVTAFAREIRNVLHVRKCLPSA
jgi:hypothetical protein